MSLKRSRKPIPGSLPTEELERLFGVRRTACLRRVMRRTGLPAPALLDLALKVLELASKRLAPSPIKRTALSLGAARWRHISPEERSEILRRAAQARWAKHRGGTEEERRAESWKGECLCLPPSTDA